eukprot:g9839.t1
MLKMNMRLCASNYRVARRKIFFPDQLLHRASAENEQREKDVVLAAGEVKMLAGNDAALPRPPDETGRLLEAWCQQCHSMCPRPLQPMDLRRVAKATLPARQCTACKHGEYVPQPGDIPEPLLGWKPKVLAALRPIDIDLGSYQRAPHGYRVHTAMINFAWAEKSVWSKIQALTKKKNRKQAEAALTYLLKAEQTTLAVYRGVT